MAKRRGGRGASKASSRGEAQKRVSEKISYLAHEGIPQKQAVGEAFGMERSGRLGRHGVYHPVGGGKKSPSRPLGK